LVVDASARRRRLAGRRGGAGARGLGRRARRARPGRRCGGPRGAAGPGRAGAAARLGGGLLRFVDGLQAQHYAQAGWLHAKITVALLASGATGVLGATLRRAAEGGEHATRFRVLFLAHLLAAAAALWLLVARPF